MGHRLLVLAALLAAAAQVGAQEVPPDLYVIEPENAVNVTQVRDCVSRPEGLECPDPDIRFNLYSGGGGEFEEMDVRDPSWLGRSRFNTSLPTVLLVHGYRGGDSLLPLVVLKDAYVKLGEHNVVMLDWGPLAVANCYHTAVRSLKAVAKCSAFMLGYLDGAGVDAARVTCVGHSLGAHICGLIANYVPKRMDKIVGLDPARPLMQLRRPDSRLDDRDARVVQVIHTNVGFYGASGMIGTADFCVNNGHTQPFCEKAANVQLCSHLHAVCFYAQSMDRSHAHVASRCHRRCLVRVAPRDSQRTVRDRLRIGQQPLREHLRSFRHSVMDSLLKRSRRSGGSVFMGEHMDDSASGMYCVTAPDPPFCRNATLDPDYGDPRCCPGQAVQISRLEET